MFDWGGWRVAHKTCIKLPGCDGRFAWLANTHLHDTLGEPGDRTRQRQALKLVRWLEEGARGVSNFIICGDFNANPNSEAYRVFVDAGFKSCYQLIHGAEPAKTFHTKIDAVTVEKDAIEDCYDYVWVRGPDIQPTAAELIGNTPETPGLYPSDHFGLVVDLTVVPANGS